MDTHNVFTHPYGFLQISTRHDLHVASIDSQTVKATEIADNRRYDGGKKIIGRK